MKTHIRRGLASILVTLLAVTGLGILRADAAVVFVQAATSMTNPTGGNAATSLSITKPVGLAAGDFMLAQVTFEKGSDANTPTPTGWTLVVRTTSGSDIGQAVFRKFATATEVAATSFSFPFSQSVKAAGSILRYTGVDTANPVIDANGSSGSSGNLVAPSINAEANSMLVSLYGLKKAGTTISVPGGMTGRVDFQNPQDVKIRVADEARATNVATGTRSATPSIQDKWVAQSVTLRQAVVVLPQNNAPVYTAAATQSATTGESAAIDLGSFTDANAHAEWTVNVNWGDSTTNSYTRDATGNIGTATHTYATSGAKTVTVHVSDGVDSSNTQTFTVNVSEADTDSDGVIDDNDNCPSTANTNQADADNDDIGDACEADTDSDGVIDDNDNCPSTANTNQADADNDDIGDACEADTDSDGVIDDNDNCPSTANTNQADADNDDIGDACEPDGDSDGVIDDNDNCVAVANTDQADADNDDIGDACEPDGDSDGVIDDNDNCVAVANTDQADADNDDIGDACEPDGDSDGVIDDNDNCVAVANTDQADADNDDIGDACEPDGDSDGVIDDNDNCVAVANTDQADADNDDIGDACDVDDDGDGDLDGADNCPLTPNSNQADTDADGIGDACDTVLTYAGDIQRMGAGAVTLKATLTDNVAACDVDDKDIRFYVDANGDGSFASGELVDTETTDGTNNSAQAIVDPATSLALGLWYVRVEFAGTAECPAASDEAMVAVLSPDDAANGGGWYQISGATGANKSVNFGFTTRWDTKAGSYRGQILVHNKQAWRLKGAITAFSKKVTTPVSGEATGTAELFCWNTATGTWKLADSAVTFKVAFNDTGVPNKKVATVKPDGFTVTTIGAYAAQNACPAAVTPLVQPTLQALKGGNVSIK